MIKRFLDLFFMELNRGWLDRSFEVEIVLVCLIWIVLKEIFYFGLDYL